MAAEVAESSCQGLADAVQTFGIVVGASVLYTLLVIFASVLCARRDSAVAGDQDEAGGTPAPPSLRASGFWIVAAVPKLTVAILLLTVLMPPCSDACPCSQSPESYYVYPIVSVLISVRFIVRGAMNLRLARRGAPTPRFRVDLPSYHHVPTAFAAATPPGPSASSGEMA
jgi:hypothetical protein